MSLTVSVNDIETAGNIAGMAVPYGIYIEDYSSLEEETMQIAHIDLIDEALLKKDRDKGIIHIYINPDENPAEASAFITSRLDDENIKYQIDFSDCRAEDWVNNWKQYFHSMPVGDKLLIRPVWDDEYDSVGRKVLNIEPGLAFGTGSHPTTKLCLETLEKYVNSDSKVLDVGCGSGILSVASLLLGAKSAFGIDIDGLAVKTAVQNAEKNGFYSPAFKAVKGDLTGGITGLYNIIAANIVADVIISFNKDAGNFLLPGGVYITGGIIDSRKEEVERSFSENGFKIVEHRGEKGWNVFVCEKL
ncbi:MAG: 50S ribosomal protein L11 methyltransferase [Clostridiales bacterium]|nr:50S ribosomal protein L11 methyltransferase [Clostridiales bacterium]